MGIFSSFFGSLFDDKPAVNVDGTPMMGDFDINGNAYGVTDADHGTGDSFLSDTASFETGGDSSLSETCSSINSDESLSSFASDDIFSSSSDDIFSSSSDDIFSSSSSADDLFSSDCDSFSSWDD